MTNKQIQSFIQKINNSNHHKTIFLHQISKDVDYGHVWDSIKSKNIKPSRFFFIKNSSEYVGAVLDMYSDLHWYITPQHRGKGYLTSALKHTILPYIFDVLERETQKISITESQIGTKLYKQSLKVALSVGFKKVDGNNLEIKCNELSNSFDTANTIFKGLRIDEVENFKKEIDNIAKRLYQLNVQLENAFGLEAINYTDTTLSDMSDIIQFQKLVLQDMQEDYKDGHIN